LENIVGKVRRMSGQSGGMDATMMARLHSMVDVVQPSV
jgi:hypothetical protein